MRQGLLYSSPRNEGSQLEFQNEVQCSLDFAHLKYVDHRTSMEERLATQSPRDEDRL